MTCLEEFGWKHPVEPGIGRVVSSHGDYYHLVCNEAEHEILARTKKSNFLPKKGEMPTLPTTGDFVRFRYNAQGDSLILDVLPRFSHFERKDPTARRASQTLAVNFDALFVMMSLNENFSLPRLRRYLVLAEEMGEADLVVILTKTDLVEETAGEGSVSARLAEVRTVLDEMPRGRTASVLAISSRTGDGLESLAPFVRPCRTVAFIGSSGVGKSSLLNALAGEEWAATQEIQAWSGKGRHTTTSRELVRLPSGALVVDTPGIREIGRLDEDDLTLTKGESTHRWRIKG